MNILVAEDDPINLLLVRGLLAPLGHSVTEAKDGTEAKEIMESQTFDLFLFDIMMPGATGLELTEICRKDPRHRDVPILVLTALSSKGDLAKGFEAGVTDYIAKPFSSSELLYRVKAQLRMRTLQLMMEDTMNKVNLQMLQLEEQKRELEEKEREISEANKLLAEANKSLLELASRDQLTGLFNRRKGWDYLHYEEEKSVRSREPLGVALFDLDKFKSVNDNFGHDVGDRVLKAASEALASTLRASDILIRWGGEEFLAVFPNTDAAGTTLAAEKIRQAVEGAPWDLPGGRKMTVSVGTVVKVPDESWEKAIELADKALYLAKERGRNQVVAWS
jgi:diguanylate cyclase (GGDEF)-like protein